MTDLFGIASASRRRAYFDHRTASSDCDPVSAGDPSLGTGADQGDDQNQ